MTKFGARGQKILKIVHFLMVGLWVGGAVALNLMLLFLGPGEAGPEVYGYDVARKFIDDCVIIPGAMGCLVSGLLISWLTPWGFFKHRWVAVKWVVTVALILFGTFYLGPLVNGQPPISESLGAAALTDPAWQGHRFANLVGGLTQTGFVVFLVVISVFKPWRKKARAQEA